MHLKIHSLINRFRNVEHKFNFKDTMPIVLAAKGDARTVDMTRIAEPLAAPWPRFSIERENDFLMKSPFNADAEFAVMALWCEELGPYHYRVIGDCKAGYLNLGLIPFVIAMEVMDRDGLDGLTHIEHSSWHFPEDDRKAEVFRAALDENNGESAKELSMSIMRSFHGVILGSLERLAAEALAPVPASGRSKYRHSGQKQAYKPSQYTYVTGKKRGAKSVTAADGKTWACDNSFPVRAHWRRLNNPEAYGVGRDSKRNVKGYTFIRAHIRGEGAFMMKPRRLT